jgi:hypothetical protein
LGTLLADAASVVMGINSLPVLSLALLVCSMPLAFMPAADRSASAQPGQEQLRARILRWQLIGMPVRFAFILGVSFVLYSKLGDSLGIAYWVAVAAFYQLSLVVQVVDSREQLATRTSIAAK